MCICILAVDPKQELGTIFMKISNFLDGPAHTVRLFCNYSCKPVDRATVLWPRQCIWVGRRTRRDCFLTISNQSETSRMQPWARGCSCVADISCTRPRCFLLVFWRPECQSQHDWSRTQHDAQRSSGEAWSSVPTTIKYLSISVLIIINNVFFVWVWQIKRTRPRQGLQNNTYRTK